MALVKTGSLISAISGNLAGVNFAMTRYGIVMRKKAFGTDAKSELQLEQRARLGIIQNLWLVLSDTERQSWRTAARAVRFRNRLGMHYSPTGWQLWLYLNLPEGPDPAPNYTLPPRPVNAAPLYNVWCECERPNLFRILFDRYPYNGGAFFRVFSARPYTVKPVTTFPHWRLTRIRTYVVQPIDIWPQFVDTWGTPTLDEVVAIKIQVWHPDLMPSRQVKAQCVVT